VLEKRIAEIGSNLENYKERLLTVQRETPNDLASKKLLFGQVKAFRNQSLRFSRLHHICCNMLEHVHEQTTISETSHVLQSFVDVHQEFLQQNDLEHMVQQFEKTADAHQEIQHNLQDIGASFNTGSGEGQSEDEDLEKELEAFLAAEVDGTEVPAPPGAGVMNNPHPESMSVNIEEPRDVTPRVVTDYFSQLPSVPSTTSTDIPVSVMTVAI